MSSFVKLYSSILDSSIWFEPDHVLRVWLAMLAMSDSSGQVEASSLGIARRANVTHPKCLDALTRLSAPDPESKSQAFEGRRIERNDRGYFVLNYGRYRDLRLGAETNDQAEARVTYRGEYVYYARCGDQIKIGRSKNPWARVKALQTARPGVELAAIEHGNSTVERQRHEQFGRTDFRNNQAGSEWFLATPELLAHVASLRPSRGRATVATVATTIEGDVEVESEAEERKEPARSQTPNGNGKLAIGELVQRIRGLAVKPPQGNPVITTSGVEALGSDIARAFRAVGGSSRFLAATGRDYSFLVKEFGEALADARREAVV